MKTSEDIKNGLEHCAEDGCKRCPYEDDCYMTDGFSVLAWDALAYITQLESIIANFTEKVARLETAQPKWISVEESQPTHKGWYQAFCKGRDHPEYLYFRGKQWAANTHYHEILCWAEPMPLPNSIKE